MDDLRLFYILNREQNAVPDENELLKNYYKSWRRTNREGFAIIYNDFKDKHLADLGGGPLKLYLFFCFAASNEGGWSYYSVNKIAELLKTSPRSVDSWIKVLVERQLIARGRTNKRVNNTYLLPYSTTLVELSTPKNFELEDWQQIFEFHLSRVNQYPEIYGDLVGIYHLFQWEQSNKKLTKASNNQVLLFITKRKGEVLTGHYYKLRRSQRFGINKMLVDKMIRFESPLFYNEYPIIGFALSHTKKLTDISNKALKVLTEQLSNFLREDDDLYEHVTYEEIHEVLDQEDDGSNNEGIKTNESVEGTRQDE